VLRLIRGALHICSKTLKLLKFYVAKRQRRGKYASPSAALDVSIPSFEGIPVPSVFSRLLADFFLVAAFGFYSILILLLS
jgi:hypothetical protein